MGVQEKYILSASLNSLIPVILGNLSPVISL